MNNVISNKNDMKDILSSFYGGTIIIKMKILGMEKFSIVADDNKTILEGDNDVYIFNNSII